jgi:hypothetical protein
MAALKLALSRLMSLGKAARASERERPARAGTSSLASLLLLKAAMQLSTSTFGGGMCSAQESQQPIMSTEERHLYAR